MYQMTIGTYSLEGKSYTAYGIRCGDIVVNDISLNSDAVETLVAQCNRGRLSPIHLADVIENFLAAPHHVA